jgi:hypothetical protein
VIPQYVNNWILKASFTKIANDGNMSLNWIRRQSHVAVG